MGKEIEGLCFCVELDAFFAKRDRPRAGTFASRKIAETAVAVAATNAQVNTIELQPKSRYALKMLAAQRFHFFCKSQGIVPDQRMPHGVMSTFIRDNIIWNAKQKHGSKLQSKSIRRWYESWRNTLGNAFTAVAEKPSNMRSEKTLLKSRAAVKLSSRFRGPGVGAKYKVPLVRQALYEWWSSIRYSIDWKQLVENRRSRDKKNLARLPRSVLRLKVQQLFAD